MDELKANCGCLIAIGIALGIIFLIRFFATPGGWSMGI